MYRFLPACLILAACSSGLPVHPDNEVIGGANGRHSRLLPGPIGSQPRPPEEADVKSIKITTTTTALKAHSAHEQGDYSKAVMLWQSLARLQPNNSEVYFSLAKSYAQLGHIEGAVLSAQSALEKGEDDYERYLEESDFEKIADSAEWKSFLASMKRKNT